MADKLDLYRQFLEEVWANGRVERLPAFVTDATESHGLITDVCMTRGDLEDLVPALRALLDAIQHDILYSYENGRFLHVMMRVSGLSKSSGETVAFTGQSLIEFDGDKIAGSQDHYDLIGLFSQLGFLPKDTVELCLSSEKIS
ncbi:ester cyclase [Thioclava litoralis]|uniref:Ester cyclase n=1 Tax=Thioclava litoralis TaxID=3076557 RepID=A0ABZ1E0M7_9RHOB|nr:ester cyclase [Thioclava sp. FTW29]